MKTILLIIYLILLFASGAIAQDPYDPLFEEAPKIRRPGLPDVTFQTENQFVMRAFYPEFYASERQIRLDIRWVERNDSTIKAIWDSLGDSALALLEDFSGIEWHEEEIEIRLLKYLRRDGLYDPLAIPLQGIKMEDYTEAAPTGLHQFMNLVKFLAGRNLMQMYLPGHSKAYQADHPLLEKTAYRFDVIALTLAMACIENLLPPDSVERIEKTEHWQKHNPDWEVYQNHFRYAWVLSLEQPLIVYLADEPYNSALVELTKPPRIVTVKNDTGDDREPFRLAAGQGRLGFSVIRTPGGFLEVVDVDSLRLAYNSGLMVGDKIRRVNGEYARNAHDLMSKILEKIDTDGAYLIVVRDDEEIGLLLLPYVENYDEYQNYQDDDDF